MVNFVFLDARDMLNIQAHAENQRFSNLGALK